MIAKLRFVERDGKRILQAAENDDATIRDGEVVWTWRDVPVESEG